MVSSTGFAFLKKMEATLFKAILITLVKQSVKRDNTSVSVNQA